MLQQNIHTLLTLGSNDWKQVVVTRAIAKSETTPKEIFSNDYFIFYAGNRWK